ncbi:hypothetical protein [Pelagibius sp. Alg239-R121]|uniref:hypothetical protein n=1 Tax=Pelagibius sp. Alg239-R121 TaxID=2993448 RepID=UPI0024A6C607|nr:hypothetical protein [Pelagibius sp. Alg239-R121]
MFKAVLLSVISALVLFSGNSTEAQEVSSRDKPFFETVTERCILKASIEKKDSLLRLTIVHTTAGQDCAFSAEDTVSLFSDLLAAHEAAASETRINSLMLGSLENYDWIQRYLMNTAREDEAWSQESGKPASMHANHYVNAILSRPTVLKVFDRAGKTHGYSFSGTSCEKVFVSDEGLPFDAFCWLELAPE